VVPKGLRAFDGGDRDFFLELLPGPRDRHGLPESVRFWKQRIEATDPGQTFAVGLLYGPSGCGKSSLVRAGLLPRLGRDVAAVYVEAAAGQTETRLLHGLARPCPGLDTGRGLTEALAALRRGEGPPVGGKVLLVLDQFEQFLHAHGREADTELVRALRQCDGVRVQALLLVRDDFWLAVTRFLAGLEIDLVQGHNTAVVDLFDPAHARKVLAAFGRAHARLAAEAGRWSAEQQAFLDQAVEGLARDGRVVPVRLALFADMVKGKPWERATLRAVGGTEGVGVAFLEESFSSPSANPRHRLHQKAVRGVLKALLPEQGTDIKGAMRSAADLEAAAGYEGRAREFADLLRILDGELRLVTPTDPEGQELDRRASEGTHQAPTAGAGPYYQLTHDYLVPAVRQWLTRKQKETRRGRAELRLAERAALWQTRRENRHLPAWWEWLNIRLFTRRRGWTDAQRQMMRWAGLYHGVRAALLGLVLAAGLAGAVGLRSWRDVEAEKQRLENERLENVRRASQDDERLGLEDLQAGRFENAIARFDSGLGRIRGEPGCEGLRERLTQRRTHAGQLVQFYHLADETELAGGAGSRFAEATVACRQSLEVLGVLDDAGWPDHLPTDGLSGPEIKRLREEVYKQMLLLVLLHVHEGLQHASEGLLRGDLAHLPTKLRQVVVAEKNLFQCARGYRPSYATSALEHAASVALNRPVDRSVVRVLQPVDALDFYLSGILHLWLRKRTRSPVMDFFFQVANTSGVSILDLATPLATAERHLRQAIALQPGHYWAYYWLAVTLGEQKKDEDAELAITTCLGLRPRYAPAYVERAAVRARKAESARDPGTERALYDSALADLAAAIDLDPHRLSAYRWQGTIFRRKKEYSRGLEPLAKVIAEEGKAIDYGSRGDLYQYLGENEKALADYSAAIVREPGAPWWWARRGALYRRLKDPARAVADLTEAIRLAPAEPSYRALRGQSRLSLGQRQEAIEDFTHALGTRPRDPAVLRLRGMALLQQGRPRQALEDFSTAIQAAPDVPALYWGRAAAACQLGRPDEARADCSRAIELSVARLGPWRWLNRVMRLGALLVDGVLSRQL
jgi:tetratricopeptide (TPR) repeat protein